MKKKTKIVLIVIIVFLLLLGGTWLGGFFYFADRFGFRTFINATDVSRMTVEEANEAIRIKDPTVSVVMRQDESGDTITEALHLSEAADLVLSYDTSKILKKQDRTLWFLSLFEDTNEECSEVSGTFSEEKLNESVSSLYCLKEENIIPPAYTHIAFENGELSIKETTDGCYVEEETVRKKVLDLVKGYCTDPSKDSLDLTKDYAKAEIPEETIDLEERLEHLQKILDKNLVVVLNNSQQEFISAKDIKDLLIFENNDFRVDDEKLVAYVDTLGDRFDIENAQYLSQSDLKRDLQSALLSEGDATVNVVWLNSVTGNGDYIEVYIGRQMLYYYRDGKELFNSPVVTGYGSSKTPTGTFFVEYFKRGATLRGADYTEYVEYWIGIDDAANNWNDGHLIGFHDASWRDAFGGDIYLSDPSHGCVNLPTDKAALVYEYAVPGTAVHIYD